MRRFYHEMAAASSTRRSPTTGAKMSCYTQSNSRAGARAPERSCGTVYSNSLGQLRLLLANVLPVARPQPRSTLAAEPPSSFSS